MFLLDTNVVSELRKANSGNANSHVVEWANRVSATSFYISVITVLELETGIMLVERRDSSQGAVLRSWFDSYVLPAFSGRIFPVDLAVARCCAKLHVPDRQSDRDAIIAATALVHGMTVATRNVDDFVRSGVDLVNPWNSGINEQATHYTKT